MHTLSFRRVALTLASGIAVVGSSFLAGSAEAQYYYRPETRNDTAEGTVVGGGLGAITGAIIGNQSGKSGEGALIGLATGAIAGRLLGKSKDQQDAYNNSLGYQQAAQANAQVAAAAITNYDLIRMTQAGVGDDLIISTVRSRGSRLDLSPEGLIALKQAGVSDRVVLSIQGANAYAAQAPVVSRPARPVVVVEPSYHPPVIYHSYRPRPYYRHHRGARFHYSW